MAGVLLGVNRTTLFQEMTGNIEKGKCGSRGKMRPWRYRVLWHGCTSLLGLFNSRQKHKARRCHMYSEQCS